MHTEREGRPERRLTIGSRRNEVNPPAGAEDAGEEAGDYNGALKDKFGVMWMANYTPPRDE